MSTLAVQIFSTTRNSKEHNLTSNLNQAPKQTYIGQSDPPSNSINNNPSGYSDNSNEDNPHNPQIVYGGNSTLSQFEPSSTLRLVWGWARVAVNEYQEKVK